MRTLAPFPAICAAGPRIRQLEWTESIRRCVLPRYRIARPGRTPYCGFAEHDPYATPDIIAELARLLASGPLRYRYEIHPGAEHGYALPNRDIHDKRAANRNWELIFAMFRRQIPPA